MHEYNSFINNENKLLKKEVQNAEMKYGLENKSLNFIGEEQEKLITKLEEEIQTQNDDMNKIRSELDQKTTDLEKLTNEKKQLEERVSELNKSNLLYKNKVKAILEKNNRLKGEIENSSKNEQKLNMMINSQK